MTRHSTVEGEAREMVRLRQAGYPISAIAEKFQVTWHCAYERIKSRDPQALEGRVLEPMAENGKPKQLVRHAKVSPPNTGSSSGFIPPLPLARLMGGRA